MNYYNIPQDLLRTSKGKPLIVSLASGKKIFGVLRDSDIYFNVKLSDCKMFDINGAVKGVK